MSEILNTEFFKNWEEAFESHKDALRPASEFDWFAVDAKGQVACFSTAGFGLVPKLVFRDKEMCWKVYDYFYEEPADYKQFSSNYTLMDYDTALYASRGLFFYDNPSDMWRPYELLKVPDKAVHFSELPIEIKDWLLPLTFKDLEFSASPKIDVSRYFECV